MNLPPDVLWRPTPAAVAAATLSRYQDWLAARRLGPASRDYAALWAWSVDELETFWRSVWDFFEVQADGSPARVLGRRAMPGAQWFPETRLNYAEHVFRHATDARDALIARAEGEPVRGLSWARLRRDVGALAATLRRLGIGAGDRVAAFMPSRPEAVVAFLACASIGAIWSSCSPDMGLSVLGDRFGQIEPRLLLAVDGYRYNGQPHARAEVVSQLLDALPSVEHVIHVPGPDAAGHVPHWRQCLSWDEALAADAPLAFERLPFDHPLWIVYSSGTTGLPKAIVHSHGGIVLTHQKTMALQHDVRPGDRVVFLGGTGWIVWNLLLGSLLVGGVPVLYDGNPAWPDAQALWRFLDEQRVSLFGCGAAYLVNSHKQGLRPIEFAALPALRAINATGSPLPAESFRWVYDSIKRDVWLASISGGTDIASGFVACAPGLPVRAGEIQCRELGVAAYAFDERGRAVVGEVGELVVTQPMPSMPVYFWNDPGQRRYRESYFEMFPGVWRHGDWIRFTPEGASVIFGRSDSTINRYGIRMGTAEIYRVVEALPEVADSLVVDLEYLGRPSFLPLFVVLRAGIALDDGLRARITGAIRQQASARHVPDAVYPVEEIPRTLTGKKMEVPVRRLLLGAAVGEVAHPDAMANPRSLDFFVRLAATLNPGNPGNPGDIP
jgi:acetoacetyl-CoA synthetase